MVAAMSDSASMNQLVHDAARRDFERLKAALSEVSDGDKSRAQDLDRAFVNLRDELTRHHQGEDRWIWPMLAHVGVNADLLATMESEHESMSAALAETGAAMGAFSATGSVTDAMAARDSVVRTQQVVKQHFSHEEEELEPVLIPHLDSPEWKAARRSSVASLPGSPDRSSLG